jgi:16S rRNA (guanine966-N2)-methyltransferase
VRETLFNWLRDDIGGARCLDLYAGSGALGFEAASRGASRVVLVDSEARVCAALRQTCELLGAIPVQVRQEIARRYLTGSPEAFDVVFLDPPFRRGWLAPACLMLEARGWLAPRAKIYIEAERDGPLDELPQAWQLLKNGAAGEVTYSLYQRRPQENS